MSNEVDVLVQDTAKVAEAITGRRFNKDELLTFARRANEDIRAKTPDYNSVRDFTTTDSASITAALKNESESILQAYSRQFFRVSGKYQSILLYYANLYTYDTFTSPVYNKEKIKNDKKKQNLIDDYMEALTFIKDLRVKSILPNLALQVLIDGVYYGLIVEGETGYVLYELNSKYCRSNNNYNNGLPTVEFNLDFFTMESQKIGKILNELGQVGDYQDLLLAQFPSYFTKAFKKYKAGKGPKWFLVPQQDAVCLYFYDSKIPLFAHIIPDIISYIDYGKLEKTRDEDSLYKLLIHKLNYEDFPDITEAQELHTSVVNMLNAKGSTTIDVLTTFGEADLVTTKDAKSAIGDNVQKMESILAGSTGVSPQLFNPEGSAGMPYAIKKDMSLMSPAIDLFGNFLTKQVSYKVGSNSDVFFEVFILPCSHYNRDEIFDKYLKAAEFGYSKLMPGVVLGMNQLDLLGTLSFENEILSLTDIMIPLSSSHTATGTESEGGAPTKAPDKKADKTTANDKNPNGNNK